MYDVLLDEFEDEATRTRVKDQPFDETVVQDVDDDEEAPAESQPIASDDGDVELSDREDLLSAIDDTDTWSDDPVRMYLTQMGEIPLLTRQQEISLAKRIEETRRQFRTRLLECDYVIQAAYKTLNRVHKGELPFDRTVQVSVTDRLEKEQILGRIPHNLNTLAVLLKRNRRDFLTAYSKSRSKADRRAAWLRLARRRRRSVRLIEELGLRTQRIEAMIGSLEKFSKTVDELHEKIVAHKKAKKSPGDRKPLVRELRTILIACQETPTSLRNRVRFLKGV
ncbi:MAG: sigma-70 factor domain-containing protein, partial [Planctomycetota bacterium]